jgi:hypothetical protein
MYIIAAVEHRPPAAENHSNRPLNRPKERKTNETEMTRRALLIKLVILVLVSVAVVLVVRYHGEDLTSDNEAAVTGVATAPSHSITEAPEASYLNIMVYDANGGVSSFMVGGKTAEYEAIAAAIRDAQPIEHPGDASFADLLVLNYSRYDTMEMSYSRNLNLFMIDDQAYRPAADLAPMITEVEKRFDNR